MVEEEDWNLLVPVSSSRVCPGLNRTASSHNGWVRAMLARRRCPPARDLDPALVEARRCSVCRPGFKGPHSRGPDRHRPDRL